MMENQFNQMTHYYLTYLRNNGSDDPVRDVVSTFCEYLKEFISKEQVEYIDNQLGTKQKNKSDAKILIQAIKKDLKTNNEFIDALDKLIDLM